MGNTDGTPENGGTVEQSNAGVGIGMGWGGGEETKTIKRHTKVVIFTKKEGVPVFHNYFVWGRFFKMYLYRRPPDWQPLAFGGNPRTHLEVQGPLGDEVTYPKFSKS